MSSRAKLPITRRQKKSKIVVSGNNHDAGLTGSNAGDENELQSRGRVCPDDDVVDAACIDEQDTGLRLHANSTEESPVLSQELSTKSKFVYEFGCIDKFFVVVSIILFGIDLGGDIYLAVEYFLKRKILYGALTVVLITGPSIITCVLGLHWYWLEYKEEAQKQEAKHKKSNHLWGLRVVMTLLQLGPIIRGCEVLYHGYKSRKTSDEKKRYHHDQMLDGDVDLCLLRLVECFLEAAPQLTLQLYVWIHLNERGEEDVIQISKRVVLLLAAWGSLAVAHVSYHRALRFSMKKHTMKKRAIPFYFMWRLTEVGTRVLCIGFFASSFHVVVLVPLGIHWLLMSIWLIYQKTAFNKKRYIEIVFNIICGYVMIFCFLNVRDGHTRFRYILYYIIFYIENAIMLGFWFMHHSHLAWLHVPGMTVVVLMAGLHIGFQLLHYQCCHPTGDIEICLPCGKNTCYECQKAGGKHGGNNDVLRPLNIEISVSPPGESR